MWDERFAGEDYVYGQEPNVFFAEQLKTLPSGKMLLPMEGEGRNAVHAGKLGWDVVAFDASAEGIKKAQMLAKSQHVTFDYHHATAVDFNYSHEAFDAVALIYAHLPPEERVVMHQGIVKALKPGGVMIAEVFHPNQLGRDSGGPKREDMLYTIDLLKQDFAGFHVLYSIETEAVLNEGAFHRGQAFVTRYVAQKPE